MRLIDCVGCKAQVEELPASYGPPHRYLGASPGCWRLYTELAAREVPDMHVRGLMADTYMVQHPGEESRQSIQSVARHLLGLYCALELRLPFRRAVQVMNNAPVSEFAWLDPPRFLGGLTVVDMWQTQEIQPALVERWAESTWQAWNIHHPVVRHWASALV